MNKKLMSIIMVSCTLASSVPAITHAQTNGITENQTVSSARVSNYDEMVKTLQSIRKTSNHTNLEIIGKSVKERDIYLVTFGEYNPNNPTVLMLSQQHGNEVMITEGALNFVKNMSVNSRESLDLISKVNILVLPRLNVDGAEGDVNFSLENYVSRTHTRYNANEIDLNRDHTDKTQPETQALHNNVLEKYKVDYMIDFHHQSPRVTAGDTTDLASGSILYPTNEGVKADVVEKSKKLGAVMYNAVESHGWGLLTKYNGGSANTIARNQLAYEYGIATMLFEMKGMIDHSNPNYVLGQKENGKLIKQAEVTMKEVVRAIANGDIDTVDTSIWDTIPASTSNYSEE